MDINLEVKQFDENCLLLSDFIQELAQLDDDAITKKHHFLAEAVLFNLFRNWERFVRSCFLHYCVATKTVTNEDVVSKLRCTDWGTAESILKAGNKFLDWGSVESVKKLSNLVFENGFPISDLVNPVASTLTDLQRFRNFIAHDSQEAETGFKKSLTQYVKVGDDPPQRVGALALYRRSRKNDITLKILHRNTSQLTTIFQQL
ncbi:hypothetical protein AT5A_09200 [Agrobacterium tumefaciens 5A]|nr:hypothetical protein AT5A_09200 [Agrobacterium tumefaciens 5A]